MMSDQVELSMLNEMDEILKTAGIAPKDDEDQGPPQTENLSSEHGMKPCIECGKEIGEDDMHCSKCGCKQVVHRKPPRGGKKARPPKEEEEDDFDEKGDTGGKAAADSQERDMDKAAAFFGLFGKKAVKEAVPAGVDAGHWAALQAAKKRRSVSPARAKAKAQLAEMQHQSAIKKLDSVIQSKPLQKIGFKQVRALLDPVHHGVYNKVVGTGVIGGSAVAANELRKWMKPGRTRPRYRHQISGQGMTRTASEKKPRRRGINPVHNIRKGKKHKVLNAYLGRSSKE